MTAARKRATPQRAAPTTIAVDLVALAPGEGKLAALLTRRIQDPLRAGPWMLPWDGVREESLDTAAHRIARDHGITSWASFVQVAALGDRATHPGKARISVAYLLLTRAATIERSGQSWIPLEQLPQLPARHARVMAAAVAKLRELAVAYPLALSLLDESFTLAAVQSMYELLLGRSVHKASFRRTLHGSGLVEPIGEWQADRRGRPAQLYRRSNGAAAEDVSLTTSA